MRSSTFVGVLLWCITCAMGESGLAQAFSSEEVTVTPWAGRQNVEPGGQLRIAVIFDHHPGWHIHTNDPQVPPELGLASDYIATQITVSVPPDSPLIIHADKIQWPPVTIENVGFGGSPVDYGVYSHRAIAYIPVTVRRDAEPGAQVTLKISVTYQACDDKVCLRPVEDERHALPPFTITAPGAGEAFEDTHGFFADFPEAVWTGLDYGPEPAVEEGGGGPPMILWIVVGAGIVVVAAILVFITIRR